ncbi:hypothetical protein EJC47_07835 [Sphingomonas sp. TF3]|uniref:hypothetical protein n=1 Tax=Sphingomonas sp. TF3 TaxID=2495580 RepID=UPI000F8992D2|nr:hypothetical protein [Sphingomonas sp. TF3]RUN76988.1 hypothetical protein EJC47_07835 [Sphingomonas sp. TF3]
MMILLPLSLIGIGAFIYFLFNAASHALPLAIAGAAALACAHVGASIPGALLVGVIGFMLLTGVVRFIGLTAPFPARIVAAAALAIPAAIAGYQLGGGLAGLSGLSAWFPAAIAGTLTGLAAAKRIARPVP